MTFDLALRLAAAFACGVAIGLERQIRQRTAGLRTITLVASGASLFVTLGVLTGNGTAGVTQISAYVVSGVGFLGGGVIMRDKGSIQGINTAATLWCSAAVGVLCGAGHYGPAVAGTAIVLLTNTVLREVSRFINATPVSNADLVREYMLTVVCREEDEIHIRTVLTNSMYSTPLSFQSLTSEDLADRPQQVRVTATLKLHPKDQPKLEQMASRLAMEKSVSSVTWTAAEVEAAPE
ncbi:MgtC/SapB family protein [Paraburkholderia caballeronis]|uniref:Protein MgtC n=1 Tax=Paraburkholderia caballeronis TaxID=416943 RepID=A0A1H7UJJ6_9BURK|nr:MgtC/SapB family protein [Paraburkholderia caballeronis]PXW17469.1 putative Mg2+ transporter-C (MgtC) family protein [Paraburkholderia caballeronis]PXW95058.1 putative Mg2+ transporter-C (MgtC) family protein [Paraburkholderia caballeronis]RAJ90904.1 putative Mg2+ transporter-C (MgtC) family protein [Paraburkholderia caballeronis]TDV07876.1 putative Mg2+ transporter-C (MgtC) family protein [Paraburkholderia caballeronis]TDV11239.1 putative Mg2+ transporter-C (MgtC) family protein [Paraburkh